VAAFLAEMDDCIPFIDEDRPLEGVLRDLLVKIEAESWLLYPEDQGAGQ
jgi:histidine ammonia-lyase